MSKYEYVNQPKHYQGKTLSAMDVIQDFNLNFSLGNVIKYTLRAGRKPDEDAIKDLEKAVWYLTKHIESMRAPPAQAIVMSDSLFYASIGLEEFARYTAQGGDWGKVKEHAEHTSYDPVVDNKKTT